MYHFFHSGPKWDACQHRTCCGSERNDRTASNNPAGLGHHDRQAHKNNESIALSYPGVWLTFGRPLRPSHRMFCDSVQLSCLQSFGRRSDWPPRSERRRPKAFVELMHFVTLGCVARWQPSPDLWIHQPRNHH